MQLFVAVHFWNKCTKVELKAPVHLERGKQEQNKPLNSRRAEETMGLQISQSGRSNTENRAGR